MSTIAPIVHPDSIPVYLRSVDTYQIYDGTDENGIVGTVAPGLFAQKGRCWRMVYENPVGHGTHCMQPVAWVGRWKFLDGWTKVWSCQRHADQLVGARGLSHRARDFGRTWLYGLRSEPLSGTQSKKGRRLACSD
jgi:hypothetical protein